MTAPGPPPVPANNWFAIGAGGQQRSKLENRTQANMESLLKADKKPLIDNAFGGFNSGLIGVLRRVFTGEPGGGPLDSVLATLRDLFSLRWAQVDRIQEDVDIHTEAIARLEEVDPTFAMTPAYIADVQDMASGARTSLVAWDGDGGRHFPTFKPEITNSLFGTGEGRTYFTPIIVDRHGKLDKLRWVVGSDANILRIDQYRMAVMVYNPANQNIEKIWDSGDIKDGAAAATSLNETWITIGGNHECTPGQLLFVAHQQIAPGLGQFSRGFGAILQAGIGRPSNLLLDASSYMSPTTTYGIPSSFAFSSLLRNNSMIPWAAVSVIPPSKD